MAQATDSLLGALRFALGKGRDKAVPAQILAAQLDISTRTLQELVGELIGRGHLVGSRCDAEGHGFFLIQDLEDLDVGTRHIRARAVAMQRRVDALKRAAVERFSEYEAGRLFDPAEPVDVEGVPA